MLLRAFHANAIPLELLMSEQNRISREEQAAHAELDITEANLAGYLDVLKGGSVGIGGGRSVGGRGSVWFQDIVDGCLRTSFTPLTGGCGDVEGTARGHGGEA
jgi:hypothetical protein